MQISIKNIEAPEERLQLHIDSDFIVRTKNGEDTLVRGSSYEDALVQIQAAWGIPEFDLQISH